MAEPKIIEAEILDPTKPARAPGFAADVGDFVASCATPLRRIGFDGVASKLDGVASTARAVDADLAVVVEKGRKLADSKIVRAIRENASTLQVRPIVPR